MPSEALLLAQEALLKVRSKKEGNSKKEGSSKHSGRSKKEKSKEKKSKSKSSAESVEEISAAEYAERVKLPIIREAKEDSSSLSLKRGAAEDISTTPRRVKVKRETSVVMNIPAGSSIAEGSVGGEPNSQDLIKEVVAAVADPVISGVEVPVVTAGETAAPPVPTVLPLAQALNFAEQDFSSIVFPRPFNFSGVERIDYASVVRSARSVAIRALALGDVAEQYEKRESAHAERVGQLDRRVEELTVQIGRLGNEVSTLKTERQNLEDEKTKLTSDNNNYAARVKLLEAASESNLKKIEDLTEERNRLGKSVENLLSEKEGLRKTVAELRAEAARTGEVQVATLAELSSSKNSVVILEAKVQSYENALAEVLVDAFNNAVDQVKLLNQGLALNLEGLDPALVVKDGRLVEEHGGKCPSELSDEEASDDEVDRPADASATDPPAET